MSFGQSPSSRPLFRKALSFVKRRVFGVERPLGFFLRELTKDPFCDQKFILADQVTAVIFDVGANIGQTASKYHSIFPASKIFSFEPFPFAFQTLTKTTSSIPQIETHQVALAAQEGEARMYIGKAHAANSLLPPVDCKKHDIPMQNEPIIVSATTLDSFCTKREIEKIDILKIDTQGSELAVLNGGSEMLRNGSISLIYSEIVFIPQYKQQATFWKISEVLADNGYVLFGLYNFVYDQIGLLHWGDAIFISHSIYDRLLERERQQLIPMWSRESYRNNW